MLTTQRQRKKAKNEWRRGKKTGKQDEPQERQSKRLKRQTCCSSNKCQQYVNKCLTALAWSPTRAGVDFTLNGKLPPVNLQHVATGRKAENCNRGSSWCTMQHVHVHAAACFVAFIIYWLSPKLQQLLLLLCIYIFNYIISTQRFWLMPLQQNVSSTVAPYLPFPPLLLPINIEIDFAFQMRLVSHSVILFHCPLVSVIVPKLHPEFLILSLISDSDSVIRISLA